MTRFTLGATKTLKLTSGVDLFDEAANWPGKFAVDPAVVSQVSYMLYKDQITKAAMTEEDFENSLDSDDIEALRSEVVRQMKGFSRSWLMIFTQMEGLLSGDTSLLEKLMAEAVE